MIASVLTVVVLAFIATRLWRGFRTATRGAGRARARRIVRGVRGRHIWPVPFVLTAIVTAGLVLIQIPGLDFGWWTAIGGVGNPVTGATEESVGTIWEWLIPAVFLALLVPALPLFAESEERMFRLGAETWSWRRRLAKTVQFGLVHALIGIPIGFALALSLGGAYFMYRYLRQWRDTGDRGEALLESTRAHTAYNGVIIGLVIVSLALSAVLA